MGGLGHQSCFGEAVATFEFSSILCPRALLLKALEWLQMRFVHEFASYRRRYISFSFYTAYRAQEGLGMHQWTEGSAASGHGLDNAAAAPCAASHLPPPILAANARTTLEGVQDTTIEGLKAR